MIGQMAYLTTKMPNPKARSVLSGKSDGKQITAPKMKPKSSSNKPKNVSSDVIVKSDHEDRSKNSQPFKSTTQSSWNDVVEQSGTVHVGDSLGPAKPKISMKIKQSKVQKSNLSVFE